MDFVNVEDFKFHCAFEVNSANGLVLLGHYVPEEIIIHILSFLEPKEFLNLSKVCKRWHNLIKSDHFWMYFASKHGPSISQPLPWYIYYSYFTTKNFQNILGNVSGERRFEKWKILENGGDHFIVESIPVGADPLPCDITDFNGRTSCFTTSYGRARKVQEISLKNKRLLRYIIKHHKPHIYASEWMAGRFDCGCVYMLKISGYGEKYLERKETKRGHRFFEHEPLFCKSAQERVEQWQGGAWKKVEIVVDQYPADVSVLVFEHEGQDTQFWKGHYGSKMAGGVLRFDFDSIQPIKEESDNQENNAFS